ncbi:MAG: YheT family hydrolase [Reyranellaceae bacterium]
MRPPKFRPRFPYLTGDLQTLANRFVPPASLAHWPGEQLRFAMADGDTLLGTLHRPKKETDRPLALLIHGLTGSADSNYVLDSAAHLLGRGHPVLRLNLRGAGPSRTLCKGQYYAGRSQDLRELLTLLPAALTANGMVAIGYSLGGAMLLKYLGEEGTGSKLMAAATVSSPIDLSATCAHMQRPRNWAYHSYILANMKTEATGTGAGLTAAERAAILRSRSVWEYDEFFIGPRHGFAGAEDYYERNKPLRFLAGIRAPTLMISAADDPWIPVATYKEVDWAGNPALAPLLPSGGGHVGFYAAGDVVRWHDRAIATFLAGQNFDFASSRAASTAP